MSVYSPSVVTRHFRSLVFDPSLEIIMEMSEHAKSTPTAADISAITNVSGVDLEGVRRFLEKARSGKAAHTWLGPCIHIDIGAAEIRVKGHPLSDTTIIATSTSPNDIVLPIEFPRENVIQTVEYFYHMATCV